MSKAQKERSEIYLGAFSVCADRQELALVREVHTGKAHGSEATVRSLMSFAVTTPRKSDRRELILVHAQNPVFGRRNTL